MRHRLLTLGPDNEPPWVQLYLYPLGDGWAATILPDRVVPPGPDEVKGERGASLFDVIQEKGRRTT